MSRRTRAEEKTEQITMSPTEEKELKSTMSAAEKKNFDVLKENGEIKVSPETEKKTIAKGTRESHGRKGYFTKGHPSKGGTTFDHDLVRTKEKIADFVKKGAKKKYLARLREDVAVVRHQTGKKRIGTAHAVSTADREKYARVMKKVWDKVNDADKKEFGKTFGQLYKENLKK